METKQTKPTLKQINITMPAELVRRLRRDAADRDRTFRAVVVERLEESFRCTPKTAPHHTS